MNPHDLLPSAYSPSDEIWLCLTTLHHRRFVEDAIHLASLPMGSRVRLRYRQKYISREIWDRAAQDVPPGSAKVLVALAATEGSQNVVRALRQGIVKTARCEGTVLILDISLESFLSEQGSEGAFWRELDQIHSSSPVAFGPKPQDGIYLQRLPIFPASIVGDCSIRAWERCADAFFAVSQAEANGSEPPATSEQEEKRSGRVPFLYHLALPQQGRRWRMDRLGRIGIEAGVSLSIDVHTITAPHLTTFHNPAGEILMDVSNSSTTFTSSRRVRIDSRRDVRAVRISTSALFRRSHGHLSIRTVLFFNENIPNGTDRLICSSDKREEVVIARHDFPLVVGNLMPILASAFVSIAAGVAVFKMPEANAEITARHFMVPIAASALAFTGLLLGLRKDAKG